LFSYMKISILSYRISQYNSKDKYEKIAI